MRRTAALESIATLPEESSIDEIIERLLIVEKIDKGNNK